MAKPHREFFAVSDDGWETPEGYPPGFTQKILSDDLDPVRRTGSRTLVMRIAPGAFTTAVFRHDECEEVFVYEGDLIVGGPGDGTGGARFDAPAYACRPGDAPHGPFRSETGCAMFVLFSYPTG